MRFTRRVIMTMLVVTVLGAVSCASMPVNITSSPMQYTITSAVSVPPTTTGASPTLAPTASPTSTATFAVLAATGGTIYSNSTCECCHGSTNGQATNGPALIGSSATLGINSGATLFDNNAQSMLDFITDFMPLFAPGTLSPEQYTDVTCYILVENNLVAPMSVFDANQLKNIPLD